MLSFITKQQCCDLHPAKGLQGLQELPEKPSWRAHHKSQLFSGMEAANVIWVKDGYKNNASHRSNLLRAIHKIDTDSNFSPSTAAAGYKVDGTFAKCHKPWVGGLFWCKSCKSQPILLCGHCAYVCHQSCETEEAWFRTILHRMLHYNPCSCKSSGCCQLTRPTRMFLWRALETIFASVGVSLFLLVITALLIPVIIVFCIYVAFVKLRLCLSAKRQLLPT